MGLFYKMSTWFMDNPNIIYICISKSTDKLVQTPNQTFMKWALVLVQLKSNFFLETQLNLKLKSRCKIDETHRDASSGVIHTPCGPQMEHLTPLPLLQIEDYIVIWTFVKPPSPFHVHMVYGWPLTWIQLTSDTNLQQLANTLRILWQEALG